ncbi:MAG: hypothetical protein BA874_03950 [Desulfuromonadales bacterium C00003068]|nr:MAG: hypothetical protein BA874_03950 [Desulfuromonadales bacterium C00003068]
MKTTLRVITALALTLMLSGCETWQGLGRDVRGLTRWGCGDCATQQNAEQVSDAPAQPEQHTK